MGQLEDIKSVCGLERTRHEAVNKRKLSAGSTEMLEGTRRETEMLEGTRREHSEQTLAPGVSQARELVNPG